MISVADLQERLVLARKPWSAVQVINVRGEVQSVVTHRRTMKRFVVDAFDAPGLCNHLNRLEAEILGEPS